MTQYATVYKLIQIKLETVMMLRRSLNQDKEKST